MRVFGEESVFTSSTVVGNSPFVPQVGLVHQHVGTAVDDQAGHPRLGQPGAVDVARLEQSQGLGVLGR